MATCSILGQALGTAVAQAVNQQVDIRKLNVSELQNTLMQDDCFIPNKKRKKEMYLFYLLQPRAITI